MKGNALINRPIYVVGAGGIGTVMAWCLIKVGESVTLVETNQNKIIHGNKNGLLISGHGSVMAKLIQFNEWQPESDSLILLCTKTYTNAQVLEKIPANASLLPIQNGFDPLLDASDHTAEGIVSFVSECELDIPNTRITRQGEFHLGPRTKATHSDITYLSQLAAQLRKINLFPISLVDDINPYKYSKLMYNAAISPLAASAGVDNSELLNHPIAKKLFVALLKENYLILKQAGLDLEKVGPIHPDLVYTILKHPMVINLFSLFFKPSLRGSYCSMAPDIHTDKTEIDAYNGHLVSLAGDFPCPINRAAINMVKNIVDNHTTPGIQHLISLSDSLPKGVLN
jgi:2-dehydropantoate 2-reductase